MLSALQGQAEAVDPEFLDIAGGLQKLAGGSLPTELVKFADEALGVRACVTFAFAFALEAAQRSRLLRFRFSAPGSVLLGFDP